RARGERGRGADRLGSGAAPRLRRRTACPGYARWCARSPLPPAPMTSCGRDTPAGRRASPREGRCSRARTGPARDRAASTDAQEPPRAAQEDVELVVVYPVTSPLDRQDLGAAKGARPPI